MRTTIFHLEKFKSHFGKTRSPVIFAVRFDRKGPIQEGLGIYVKGLGDLSWRTWVGLTVTEPTWRPREVLGDFEAVRRKGKEGEVRCSLNRWRLIADLLVIDRGYRQVDSIKRWGLERVWMNIWEVNDDQGSKHRSLWRVGCESDRKHRLRFSRDVE